GSWVPWLWLTFCCWCVCVPLEILQYFLWTPRLTLPVCRLSSYCELLSAVASVLNLTAVSLERYIVIVYPMRSRTFCTLSNCRRAIVVVWCISLALSVPAGLSQVVNKRYNIIPNETRRHDNLTATCVCRVSRSYILNRPDDGDWGTVIEEWRWDLLGRQGWIGWIGCGEEEGLWDGDRVGWIGCEEEEGLWDGDRRMAVGLLLGIGMDEGWIGLGE
ncbi:hypothetical protein Pmani_028824, partial [Petrolisthes manimaculis]